MGINGEDKTGPKTRSNLSVSWTQRNKMSKIAVKILNYKTIRLILHANKVMFQILWQTLLPNMEWEMFDIQEEFKKMKRQ